MNRYIFLDFDETLGHTFIESSMENARSRMNIEQTDESVLVNCFEIEGDTYLTFLRTGVMEFLEWCRKKIDGNVYILTSATKDYITNINNLFSLGFTNDQLISREDIYYPDENLKFNKFPKEGEYILVDNMSYSDHRSVGGQGSKIDYLHNLSTTNYIQVLDYIPFCYDYQRDEFDYMKQQIETIFID